MKGNLIFRGASRLHLQYRNNSDTIIKPQVHAAFKKTIQFRTNCIYAVAVIPSERSYSALLLAEQQILWDFLWKPNQSITWLAFSLPNGRCEWFVHPGPLVLGTASIKLEARRRIGTPLFPRHSDPLAYFLSCEQPYPWEFKFIFWGFPAIFTDF